MQRVCWTNNSLQFTGMGLRGNWKIWSHLHRSRWMRKKRKEIIKWISNWSKSPSWMVKLYTYRPEIVVEFFQVRNILFKKRVCLRSRRAEFLPNPPDVILIWTNFSILSWFDAYKNVIEICSDSSFLVWERFAI